MVGAFIRSGRTVRFEAAPGIETMVDGKPERSAAMQSDLNGNPTRLLVGPLSFVIIERGDRIGLRVRDPEASARKQFAGLKYYPYDPAWRLQGRFEPFPEPRIMRVADVSGGTQEHQSPGELAFTFDRQTFRLQVIEEPGEDDYFVIFRDQTAGSSTYESGRFLYVAKPHADGLVIADFNRAYTPPCGFTAFTTCPLPPRQNWLPFSIRAGELRPENHPQE
jgi:uncharacterized protein (DUF1684 family)